MIHQKKNRGHRTSKIVKSRKSYSNGHRPIICSFYYKARALMYDVACEFACAVQLARTSLNLAIQPRPQCPLLLRLPKWLLVGRKPLSMLS